MGRSLVLMAIGIAGQRSRVAMPLVLFYGVSDGGKLAIGGA